MNKKIWRIEDDEYIKNNLEKLTFLEMSKHLNCSISTIQNRAIELGLEIKKGTKRRWTSEEIDLLRVMSQKYLNKTIAKKLNRSVQEVNQKARTLGIQLIFKRSPWVKWKENFLIDNLNKMSLTKISETIEISYYQISEKINELGLIIDNNEWTDEEEYLLRYLVSKCYIKEIANVLNRTEAAIVTKARNLNLDYITTSKVYTLEELNYIKTMWGKIPVVEIARKLQVSRIMVDRQAELMNLPKLGNNPYRKWTPETIDKLRKLAMTKTAQELADKFHTTISAIHTVASDNKIPLIDTKTQWTNDDIEELRKLAKIMDLQELASKLNRTTSAIRLMAKRKGIEIIKNKQYQESVWTQANTNQLIKLVEQDLSLLQIAQKMNKKDDILLKKAKELGLKIKKEINKPWSDTEIKRFIEASKIYKLSELVSLFERTSSSIKSQASKLGIKIIPDRKNWTEEEYQRLEHLVMIEKKSPKEIAQILDRSEDSVIIKINRRGLKIQTNKKRYWTKEEEELLSDLWGNKSIEYIAKKLNRTVSSVSNKVFLLGLGSHVENNYDGLRIQEICELFNVSRETVSDYWIALGLKYHIRKVTTAKSYLYIEIKDLYDFLENNQNIWDSRYLEKNILGIEPEWLIKKRKDDEGMPLNCFRIDNLIKQQLINENLFYLEESELDNDILKKIKTIE